MAATKDRVSETSPTVTFDPLRRATSRRLQVALALLSPQLLAAEQRTRRRPPQERRKLVLAAEVLICNFIAVRLLGGPEQALGVPRDNNAMWSGSRYHEPVFGAHFLAALAAMEGTPLSWVRCLSRGYRYADTGRGKLTALFATPNLWAALGFDRLEWTDLARVSATEPLILRGPKAHHNLPGPTLDYADTDRTRKARREVQRINRYLEAAPIEVLPPTDDFPTPIDPTQRTVRRNFNNGSWIQGGRLWGAFWESLERRERFARMRIAGEPIANVDFAQLFLALLYMREGLPAPVWDLYDINGDGLHRDGWKRVASAMLFANVKLANFPDGVAKMLPKGLKVREAEARMLAHPRRRLRLLRISAMRSGWIWAAWVP